MPYEIFTKKVLRSGNPIISISRLGRIGINQPAARTLKEHAVEFVLLLWDKDRRRIAFRPISKKDTRAYTITYDANGKSAGAGFSAKTFFDYVGYDYSETRSIPVVWNEEEKMFEADLPAEHIKEGRQPKLIPMQAAS